MKVDSISNPSTAEIESGSAVLSRRFQQVRQATQRLCEPLAIEDYVVQSMPDVSPTKWHLAHTTWFFETFLLAAYDQNYRVFHPQYGYLFNSYYISVGERHARPQRGLLSRPTVADIRQYRAYVDEHMTRWLEGLDERAAKELAPLLELGLNHEQQHQELMLTDIKHVLGLNPLKPAYGPPHPPEPSSRGTAATPNQWVGFEEGVYQIGHADASFCYDNELPRHRILLGPFKMGTRLVTNGEYREFIEDGGYGWPTLWLSDGWATVESQGWNAPLYWIERDGSWFEYTLAGVQPLAENQPVCHLSYFEAEAYARWAGARLPTEFEWEVASFEAPIEGNFMENGRYHPAPAAKGDAAEPRLQQMFGDVWEWTASQYSPYPGYRPAPGAVGEYNGKFMCNQFVLRGGSCATPQDHIRRTYRNFFQPAARWQFTGLRLARDA